ncbi:hypothetical protein XI25_04205 [Paenibacillus sp. DMB20]|nr:hypothetical protein XI25_04205 [Paenibacillus sp. DMB20]
MTHEKTKTLLAAALACGLFASVPVTAAPADTNNGGPQAIEYADLDQKLAEAAEKAIEQYGNGKTFQLEEASKDKYLADEKNQKESWIIQAKDRSAVISVDAISGEVLTVSLSFAMDEVTEAYETHLKAAQSEAKQLNGKSETSFTQAHFFKSNNKLNQTETITFSTDDDQFLQLDAKTGKLQAYQLKYKAADVDRKITATAEKAVKSMGNSKVLPFTDIERKKYDGLNGEEVWDLKRKIEVKGDPAKYGAVEMGKDGKTFVVEATATVEVKTGKLVSVTVKPKTDNQKGKTLTEKEGIALAGPAAKKLFGVSLSDYTLKVDKDWGDYKFSSKGKESIVAKFDGYGNLLRMERKS